MPVGTGLNQVPTQLREVTSLAADGAGSFAAAIADNAGGAGVVVDFDTAGNIDRIGMPDLLITSPGIHIRGENAPGEGINLVGSGLRVKASNTVVSGFRIVPGDVGTMPSPSNRDCLGIEGEAQDVHDVLVRWMTFAYSVDGLLDFWSTRIRRLTVEDCIFAEPLDASTHPSGNHSTALLVGKGGEDILIRRNLFAHWRYRTPAIRGPFNGAFINNLLYNGNDRIWQLYGADTDAPGGTILLALIGNHHQVGPQTPKYRTNPPGFYEPCQSGMSAFPASRVYMSDNTDVVASGLTDPKYQQARAWPTTTPVIAGLGYALMTGTNPVDMTGLSPMASGAVKAYVLANAGPRRADGTLRDSILETRIRAEVTDGAIGSLKNTVPAAEAAYFGFPSPPSLTYGDIDDTAILAAIKAEAEARYADNATTDTTLLPSATHAAITSLMDALNVGAGQPLATVEAVRAAALSIGAEAEALVESIDRQRANNSKPFWQG